MPRARLAFIVAAALTGQACATVSGGPPPQPTPIWIRSHNRNAVDVYLSCGWGRAVWLGSVLNRGSDGFQLPPGMHACARGLNFLLVAHGSGRGYWIGPFRPQEGQLVDLVIEKYAGLSSVQVRSE